MRTPAAKKIAGVAVCVLLVLAGLTHAQRQMENLGRGVVAVSLGGDKVYVGWRMLGTDPNDIAFNVYRDNTRVNDQPITDSTNFTDGAGSAPSLKLWSVGDSSAVYTVRSVINGKQGEPSAPAKVWSRNYLEIPLQTPPRYTPNDASVGDLDGDGEYEIVLHQTGRGADNASRGRTDAPILEAYRLDGAFLWRINLGTNIREGAHYTQYMVYDLDGDGKAEVACKTADGTVDGKGKVIGDPNANWVNRDGKILDGPEFFTIFEGKTGAVLATTDYVPPRGNISGWGGIGGNGSNDNNGNRVDRFLACVAYLDGVRPSVVMCRGYYGRSVLAAWDWRDGRLTSRWVFDSAKPGLEKYSGMGNHNLTVADVDADGKDEIIYGSMCVDDNGTGLYSTNLRHGDAMHVSDLDPGRPGLEVWGIHENEEVVPGYENGFGAALFDARTGEILWGKDAGRDVGRGVAADIDPRHPGAECWGGAGGLRNIKGEEIGARPRSQNFLVWWDGDLLRELLDRNRITKWDWEKGTETPLFIAEGCSSNNGSKATPALSADLFGDWREEVIFRTTDGRNLRIYTTTIPTTHRFYTLMHDPQYRLSITWQNVAYNQPPHVGFYLGHSMKAAPRPNIVVSGRSYGKPAAKPLFRDPVYDGAADPVLCWNRAENKWFMFYTNRRANAPNTPGVTWVHGTRIGIAESSDGGATWKYRGTADIDYGQADYTYWAPEVIYHDGLYHMFLSIVPGIFPNWNASRHIIHLTSGDLLKWKYESTLNLASDKVIDACVIRLADGTWRMWYKNERDKNPLYYADSPDLYKWQSRGNAISDRSGEGPKVFRWKGRYWMIADVWQGLGVYSSDDCRSWNRQEKNLLSEGGQSPTDRNKGGHADVVVSGERAFLFYFVHQGGQGDDPNDPYVRRRSVIQVVELEYQDGKIACDRNKPTYILLEPGHRIEN